MEVLGAYRKLQRLPEQQLYIDRTSRCERCRRRKVTFIYDSGENLLIDRNSTGQVRPCPTMRAMYLSQRGVHKYRFYEEEVGIPDTGVAELRKMIRNYFFPGRFLALMPPLLKSKSLPYKLSSRTWQVLVIWNETRCSQTFSSHLVIICNRRQGTPRVRAVEHLEARC
jgi:hypothetical protein